jgi:hypothetical protein
MGCGGPPGGVVVARTTGDNLLTTAEICSTFVLVEARSLFVGVSAVTRSSAATLGYRIELCVLFSLMATMEKVGKARLPGLILSRENGRWRGARRRALGGYWRNVTAKAGPDCWGRPTALMPQGRCHSAARDGRSSERPLASRLEEPAPSPPRGWSSGRRRTCASGSSFETRLRRSLRHEVRGEPGSYGPRAKAQLRS